MNCSKNYSVKVIATGFFVLVLLSVPLFWARFVCETILVFIMPQEATYVFIEPSGLVPPELENDSKVVSHSHVSAGLRNEGPLSLGISDYFRSRAPGGRYSHLYHYDVDDYSRKMLYFDERKGLIVYCRIYAREMPGETTSWEEVRVYAGPEGISETSHESLGRFMAPVDSGEWYWTSESGRLYPLRIFFDKGLRRFFKIDFDRKSVVKGPELEEEKFPNPVQIGSLSKNWFRSRLNWLPPMINISERPNENEARRLGRARRPVLKTKPIIERFHTETAGSYLLVLDESGRIDLLDRETLEFAGGAGHLPAPPAFFSSGEFARPKDLLNYEVLPLTIGPEDEYRGIFVAGVSREGTAMAVAVFDKEGKLLTTKYTQAGEKKWPSSRAVFLKVPWAPTLMITKYLLESLQPPVLGVASYLSAYSFEAAAGHRALFILPNSFVGMKGRQVGQKAVDRYVSALLLLLPSILFGVFLGWRVAKDAVLLGFSENARFYWILATVAFGLVGYIAYRLTRPETTLVTCVNCGRLRRPDMVRCHHCGSKWLVPELTPPDWRVVD